MDDENLLLAVLEGIQETSTQASGRRGLLLECGQCRLNLVCTIQ